MGYAVAVVFLRTFISHFGDVKRPSGDWVELVFLCLGWGWLLARTSKSFRRFLDIYQPDEFATQFAVLRRHLRNLLFQDANSIYSGLLIWILVVITALHHLKNLVGQVGGCLWHVPPPLAGRQPRLRGGGAVHRVQDGRRLQPDLLAAGSSCSPPQWQDFLHPAGDIWLHHPLMQRL